MTPATRPANFVEGREYPSPVTHLIAFDYSNGVTEGALKTGDGSVYHFNFVGGEADLAKSGPRTFELTPLPASAFEAIVGALEPYAAPKWPCWIPLWTYPSDAVRATVEAAIDRALATAEQPTWRVESRDLVEAVSATAVK